MALTDEAWVEIFVDVATDRDARYIVACKDCNVVWIRERDCPLTKGGRKGERYCPQCEEPVELVRDAKDDEDHYSSVG